MKSESGAKRGSQEPRIKVEPYFSYSDGEDACFLMRSYGQPADPWQAMVLDAWLARNSLDTFAATTCGLSVPRQNGKNWLLEARELYGITQCHESILHTAHEVKTARKAFLRLCSYFEQPEKFPELAEKVHTIRRTNGQEAIILKDGGQVEFSARSRGAARGFTADVVVMDEAQELTDEQLEALMYAISASPNDNRQMIYVGTPPPPRSPGTVFARLRKSVMDGTAPERTCWHEWSVEQIGDVADRSRWYETNPAMGIRITEDFTAIECGTSSAEGFARERLGWWAPTSGAQAALIPAELWQRGGVERAPESGTDSYGVKFAPDGSRYALAFCRTDGERHHAELVSLRPMGEGIRALSDWLIARKEKGSCVVIDGKAEAKLLVQALNDAGCPRGFVVTPSMQDVGLAASMVIDGLVGGTFTHAAIPGQAALDASAQAPRRAIGTSGGYGFATTDEIDSTPIEAVSLALLGARTSKRNPKKKLRIA